MKLFSEYKQPIFKIDKEHPQFANLFLSESAAPIFAEVESFAFTPKQWIESEGFPTVDCIFQHLDQDAAGKGVAIRNPVKAYQCLASYGGTINFGRLTGEEGDKLNMLAKTGGMLSIWSVPAELIGSERECFWEMVRDGLQESIVHDRYALFGYDDGVLSMFYLDGNLHLVSKDCKQIPGISEHFYPAIEESIKLGKSIFDILEGSKDLKNALLLKAPEEFKQQFQLKRAFQYTILAFLKDEEALTGKAESGLMLYSKPEGQGTIADMIQHAPDLDFYSGMPFLTTHLAKANVKPMRLKKKPQNIPCLALLAKNFIPEGLLLRDYGTSYLEKGFISDIMRDVIIWNKDGKETALCLYHVTRGQIEAFKKHLQKRNVTFCISFLRSTVPDFLYHLSAEEMQQVENLIETYVEDDHQLQQEREIFISQRYPRFIEDLERLEAAHHRFCEREPIAPFYLLLFKNNQPEDIFNHPHSAFNALQCKEFSYPSEVAFNKDKYYLFPIDVKNSEPPKKIIKCIQELRSEAKGAYDVDDFPKAIKLWLDALSLSKDYDFYRAAKEQSWEDRCKGEEDSLIGGPLSGICTSRRTLGLLWNLANAYRALDYHEDAAYFFTAYQFVFQYIPGFPSNVLEEEQLVKVRERLAESCEGCMGSDSTHYSYPNNGANV